MNERPKPCQPVRDDIVELLDLRPRGQDHRAIPGKLIGFWRSREDRSDPEAGGFFWRAVLSARRQLDKERGEVVTSGGLQYLSQAVNDVQKRADDEVRRARSQVVAAARHQVERAHDRIDAHETGAGLGQFGQSDLTRACQRLDAAKAQAAAVRNVWLHLVSTLGPEA